MISAVVQGVNLMGVQEKEVRRGEPAVMGSEVSVDGKGEQEVGTRCTR